jgi:peroxiredoxin
MVPMKWLHSILILLVFSTKLVFAQVNTIEPDSRGYIVKVGDTCPSFRMTLTDGRVVDSKEFNGKVVMLQFTASWCIVCKKEMPHIEADIQQKYKDRDDFILIGIDRDEPLEKVQAFAKEMKISYPLALDPGAQLFQLFAAKEAGVTRNIIIGRNGRIIFLTRLYEEQEFEMMKRVIADALAKP